MQKLILIKKIQGRRASAYVLRTPNATSVNLHSRFVVTTRYASKAKRYKSIEAAQKEILRFKELNIFSNWEVVEITRTSTLSSATV